MCVRYLNKYVDSYRHLTENEFWKLSTFLLFIPLKRGKLNNTGFKQKKCFNVSPNGNVRVLSDICKKGHP
jgi:hypothetical protein